MQARRARAGDPRGLHAVNGIRLFAAEAGRGRPLVLLHGLGWDHSLWGRTISRYAGRYRVLAGDHRGHGRSEKPPGPYSLHQFRDDWLALLDTIGVESACLVGLSLGGMVAMLMALERPELAAALVLISTACRTPPEARSHMEARIAATLTDGAGRAARLAASSIFSSRFREAHPGLVDEFIAWRTDMPQEPLFATIRAGYEFDICARLGALTQPCLVMAGADDALVSPETTREIARRIPHAEFELVPGCGHMVPTEHPIAFEASLDRFLARHYPP